MLAVLVVEREELVREVVTDMLGACDHVAVGMETPELGLKALEGVGFDIMILDLSANDPAAEIVALRAKVIFPNVKIIGMCGRHPRPRLSPGIDAFLMKPFTVEQLKLSISELRHSTK